MLITDGLLRKWARRADVEVTAIGELDVLRFGKGGARGDSRSLGVATVSPYKVPIWVTKKIAKQKARLAEVARLKRY